MTQTLFGISDLGYWDLFDIWDLAIGIYCNSSLFLRHRFAISPSPGSLLNGQVYHRYAVGEFSVADS